MTQTPIDQDWLAERFEADRGRLRGWRTGCSAP
jgi:hypothetical protein